MLCSRKPTLCKQNLISQETALDGILFGKYSEVTWSFVDSGCRFEEFISGEDKKLMVHSDIIPNPKFYANWTVCLPIARGILVHRYIQGKLIEVSTPPEGLLATEPTPNDPHIEMDLSKYAEVLCIKTLPEPPISSNIDGKMRLLLKMSDPPPAHLLRVGVWRYRLQGDAGLLTVSYANGIITDID